MEGKQYRDEDGCLLFVDLHPGGWAGARAYYIHREGNQPIRCVNDIWDAFLYKTVVYETFWDAQFALDRLAERCEWEEVREDATT